jgi:uncharacterized membrane protein
MADLALLAATITTGIVAGLFFAYANSVMPALRGADDDAFVDVMQRINAVILNPLFLGTFLGGLLIGLAAAGAVVAGDDHRGLAWVVAGVGLYSVMFAITRAANIPLNVQLAEAGTPGAIGDLDAVRTRFERRWTTWNLVRALASTAAFCCFAAATLLR